MQCINVPLNERAYQIYIGSGIRNDFALLQPLMRPKVVIVTNTVVAPLYLAELQKKISDAAIEPVTVILPDGEQYKNWQSLNTIFDALLEHRCERSTPLIALGGGVIGDTTGFAAACYQRGAPFIQMPTTLLSQVDSSVGGKTAINHPLGKNMVGAFYQPKRVIIDTETLASLPDREFSAGMAEVIKYGLIRDEAFLCWLEDNIERLRSRQEAVIEEAIARSCQNKVDVVLADETEQGERALLNLGHTFGHAIETGMGYGEWLHGEAVAAGTMMAAELSRLLGWLTEADVSRIETIFGRAGLPTRGPAGLDADRYLELMAHDKKVIDGKLRLVLLNAPGKALVTTVSDSADIVTAITNRTA